MSLDLTIVPTAQELSAGLADWSWLDLAGKTPFMASLFGHVFLAGADGIWWLDPIGGTLTLEWPDRDSLRATLATDRGQDDFLLGGLALAADRQGITRADHQIYVFTPPPILGGGFAIDHLMAMDVAAGLSIQGQLHRQLREGRA